VGPAGGWLHFALASDQVGPGNEALVAALVRSGVRVRELREELMMVEPTASGRRYTLFEGNEGEHNRPEYLKALALWQNLVGSWPSLDSHSKIDIDAEIRWEEHNAPDFVTIVAGDYGSKEFGGVYVNITTEDCAIEVDKIAVLTMPSSDVRLLDGEVYGGELVNRPIGLFNTKRFGTCDDIGLPKEQRAFTPDHVFHSGALVFGDIEVLIADHLKRLGKVGLLPDDKAAAWHAEPNKLKFCPITNSMLRRHVHARTAAT